MAVEQRAAAEADVVNAVLDYREYVQLVRAPEGRKIVETLWGRT